MKSKMRQLYDLYVSNPQLSIADAAAMIGSSEKDIRTMRYRLENRGIMKKEEDGSMTPLKPFPEAPSTAPKSAAYGYKSQIYEEMVETYMDDFRAQTTFVDRLAVGREIRLILEKM